MSRQTAEWVHHFRGHQLLAATASGTGGPFVKADTSSAGAPTIVGLDGGGIRMLLAADAEAENLCIYFGDKLSFDIDDIIKAWFIVATVATLDSTTSIAWGLTGARNDAIDSIAQAAIFRVIGDNSVVVETDDGTTDLDDKPTGLTLGTAWKRFEINFAERNSTREPPSVSLGRKSNIGFYGANDLGSLRRVASGTRFDMSAYTGGLQPFFQLQKTSDDNVNSFDILACGVEFNLPQ